MGEEIPNIVTGAEKPPTVVVPEKSGSGKNYIIAIGIDQYKLRKLNLKTCITDCNKLTEILVKKYEFTLFDRVLANQEATKSAVFKLFKAFRELETTAADSLLVFFSGHGYLSPITRDQEGNVTEGIGCWVTHEAESLDPNDLLKVSDVIDEVRRLKHLKHILLISDCCNSGALLETPTFYNRNGRVPPYVQSLEMAPSRWAICSSRSNELSTAGNAGDLSRFTTVLVNELEKNAKPRLLLNTLFAAVQEAFEQKAWQKPYAAPLDIIDNNGGQFVFKAAEDLVIIKKRELILKAQLNTLNYTNQRSSFREISKKGKIQFTIFSGLPTCGLNLLSNRARKSLAKIPQAFPVTHDKFIGTGETRLINGLKEAFGIRTPATTLEKVREDILRRLQASSITLELRFYHDPTDDSEATMPPQHKKALLDELATFATAINNAIVGDYSFYIFVIDYELCNYETLYNNSNISNIDTTFIPRTKPIEMAELCEWYDRMELTQDDPEDATKLQEFRVLFEEMRVRLEQMITETKGYPGSMLLKICEEAKCRDLASKLLDPDKN